MVRTGSHSVESPIGAFAGTRLAWGVMLRRWSLDPGTLGTPCYGQGVRAQPGPRADRVDRPHQCGAADPWPLSRRPGASWGTPRARR